MTKHLVKIISQLLTIYTFLSADTLNIFFTVYDLAAMLKCTIMKCTNQMHAFRVTSSVFCASIPNTSAAQSSLPHKRMPVVSRGDVCIATLQSQTHQLMAVSHHSPFHHRQPTHPNCNLVFSTKMSKETENQA